MVISTNGIYITTLFVSLDLWPIFTSKAMLIILFESLERESEHTHIRSQKSTNLTRGP